MRSAPGPSKRPPGYVEPATKAAKPKKKVRVRAGAAKPPRPPEKKEARESDDDDDSGDLMPRSRRTLKTSAKSSKLPGNADDANPKAKAKARATSFLMRMRMCNKKDKSKSKGLKGGREKRARVQELIRKRQEEKNKIFGNAPLVIGSSDEEA